MAPNERVLVKARIALRADWFRLTIGVLIGVVFLAFLAASIAEGARRIFLGSELLLFAAFVAVIGPPVLRCITSELVLTNKRVVAKFGFFSLRTLEMKIDRIESIGVQQSLFGRLLNYGTITVIGTGASHEPFPDIVDPVGYKMAFDAATDNLNTAGSGGK